MFTLKIGITGHRPSGFSNPEFAKKICKASVDFMIHKHVCKSQTIEFNAGGCIGADQWVINQAIDKNIPYNLYLPFAGSIQSKLWTSDEKACLRNQILKAKSAMKVSNSYSVSAYHIRDRKIVDNSHFMICFWEGKQTGGTYQTIKYALNSGKKVLNALNELEEIREIR